MTIRVVGAGLGRTGTTSLKAALEQLLGGPCHHMFEVAFNPEQVPMWTAAARGEPVDWDEVLDGYRSIVDWPGVSFWRELTDHYPDALVLLSVRDPDAWYESARSTIFVSMLEDAKPDDPWTTFIRTLFGNRFTLDLDDKAATLAAFEAHYAAVRATVPTDRLLEWTVADGWGPLCAALDVPVPDDPFPRLNTRDDWAPKD
ncbi:MAG: sulfotransferase family protein [Acidimicrobiales bacterium]